MLKTDARVGIMKDGVRQPIDYSRLIEHDRIHSSLYVDPDIFNDELRKIFYGGWVFVGHDSEVPKLGDFVTRWIGFEPVVMLRNKDGEIRVHVNRCPHRGNNICSIEKGHARILTCEYHGWTFSLDGDLVGVPRPDGFCKEKSELGLRSLALVQSYRGFVFASFNPDSGPLERHLGHAAAFIDRAVDMSPVGKILLNAGWIKHDIMTNWKMLIENATDGYHAPVVHTSFLRVFRSQYDATAANEEHRVAETKDWGDGHAELNFVPRYKNPLEWMGSTEAKQPNYVAQMKKAYGEERAYELMTVGAPHITIFPNLFIGEANIVIFQPLSVGRSVQWHTPMLLEGVDDQLNTRTLRQSEGALGPSSFLVADDAAIFERQQMTMSAGSDWLDLSRGLNRQEHQDGIITGYATDEVSTRAFWRHYLPLMEVQ